MKPNDWQKYLTGAWWTENFSLIARHHDRLEDRPLFAYTPSRLVFFGFISTLLIFTGGFWLARSLYKPQGLVVADAKLGPRLKKLNFMIDSLVARLEVQNQYIGNIQKLLGGDVVYMKAERPAEAETPADGPPKTKPKVAARPDTGNLEKSIDFLAKADQRLRQEMEQFQGGGSASETGRADQLPWLLRSPLRGLVSEKFDARTEHYGVDIVAEKDAPIQAIAEGTVLMSTWTEDTGYVITLQHPGGMVSVYKHCSRLLKKSGDFVKSGEAIAIIGNTGKFTSGPHLHLELWLRGSPQNPEDYIAF